ncbi:4-(cytidine 5'-diphospho)-2-C-methyl-D-erythritol kinase [Sediminibacterium ginsengisoli]|uniref:4-diphosphocytidyl-2-C-methyl-D-erythritol kinase n=1 Tax=Sediminibacterium ginsengisoli TaxID=413434 RepID=A0A1T4L4H0_9BACT|nr:4-(cytidine 5'-diphospho)-2-C-methyl-D-erythritol kinase [Sediminibacterium ginsengisoli]SJZ49622.1 4-diphosphocytidyl-2-C-methyl-D-erythritol kinase [Sediminibacterium ginsengisoli]
MVVFPNCKINLGLNIVRKRTDGYHDLETIFLPVSLRDALEILPAGAGVNEISFTASGLPVNGRPEDNLCIRAWQLLKKDYPGLPAVKMHLHKAIPMGAGLGGGSADGTFTLRLLSDMFQLAIPDERLSEYALELGSDCPFFLLNKPCFAKGRGEEMEPLELDLSGYKILLVHPGIHISTGWAFAQIRPAQPSVSLKERITMPPAQWKQFIKNDFETPVLAAYPELAEIKDQLYRSGAVYASLSGTGSTIYGIYQHDATIPSDLFRNYSVSHATLSSRPD